MDKIVNFLMERAAERSSWIGLAAPLSAAGISFFSSPEAQGAVATLGLAISGLVGIVLKEKGN